MAVADLTREELIARAVPLHDETGCRCDRKYLMSCPQMASAILRAGRAAPDAALQAPATPPPEVLAAQQLATLVKAAVDYDLANRGRGNYQSVPERQVARLITGAIKAMSEDSFAAALLASNQGMSDALAKAREGLAEVHRVAEQRRLTLVAIAGGHHDPQAAAAEVLGAGTHAPEGGPELSLPSQPEDLT